MLYRIPFELFSMKATDMGGGVYMYLHFQTLYGKFFLTDFFFILEAKTYQQIKR